MRPKSLQKLSHVIPQSEKNVTCPKRNDREAAFSAAPSVKVSRYPRGESEQRAEKNLSATDQSTRFDPLDIHKTPISRKIRRSKAGRLLAQKQYGNAEIFSGHGNQKDAGAPDRSIRKKERRWFLISPILTLLDAKFRHQKDLHILPRISYETS